jgi:hypothetical protein
VAPEAAGAESNVVEITDHIRETMAKADAAIHEMAVTRTDLAIRLALLKAATDPEIEAAVADYEERVETGRGYDARSAELVLADAWQRFTD